jgi:hypothetical protein
MNLLKNKVLILITSISSLMITAQTVDLVASVDALPPLNVGQTFTYTLQAVAGTTEYLGLQIDLEYNAAVIQLNSITPDNSVIPQIAPPITSTLGEITYGASAAGVTFSGTAPLFTAVFEVISTSESVIIEHQLYESTTNGNGTIVINSAFQNVTGSSNSIILATLTSEENNFSESLSIFPNPVSDVLYIKTNTASAINNISIHSINGKRIQQIENINTIDNQIAIPVRHLEDALYFLTITSVENEVTTFKILINQ